MTEPEVAATPAVLGSQATVTFWVDGGAQTHAGVAAHESVAGIFVEHTPLPPTQVYAGLDAAVPQADGQVGAVHVPVAHAGVAAQESVAGVFVEHTPLPPTQVYAGLDAAVLQAVWHVGAVHVPVASGAAFEAEHIGLGELPSGLVQIHADPILSGI